MSAPFKADDKRQVVAVARLVLHAAIGAAGLEAAIQFFLLKQELWSVNIGGIHLMIYGARTEDVVDAAPLPLIAIGSADTMQAASLLRQVAQAVLEDTSKNGTVSLVVEVASYQNMGIGRKHKDGVDSHAETVGHSLTERAAVAFAAVAAGSMDDKDMQRVAVSGTASHVEDITGWTHTVDRFHMKVALTEGGKDEGTID